MAVSDYAPGNKLHGFWYLDVVCRWLYCHAHRVDLVLASTTFGV